MNRSPDKPWPEDVADIYPELATEGRHLAEAMWQLVAEVRTQPAGLRSRLPFPGGWLYLPDGTAATRKPR